MHSPVTFSGSPPTNMVRQPRGLSLVVGGGARRLGGTSTQVLQCRGFFMGTVRPSGDIIQPNMPQVMRKSPLWKKVM